MKYVYRGSSLVSRTFQNKRKTSGTWNVNIKFVHCLYFLAVYSHSSLVYDQTDPYKNFDIKQYLPQISHTNPA